MLKTMVTFGFLLKDLPDIHHLFLYYFEVMCDINKTKGQHQRSAYN